MDEKTETLPASAMNTVAPHAGGTNDTADDKPKRKEMSFPLFLLLVVLGALAFRSFAFSLFNIPSESMLPRLLVGDYLVASKWSYGISKHSLPVELGLPGGRLLASDPARGDVVIFKHPVDHVDYVKRVIGLPGDIVELRDGLVVVNGNVLPQRRVGEFRVPVSPNTDCPPGIPIQRREDGIMLCRYALWQETNLQGRSYQVLDFGKSPQDNWGPRVVPEGRLFLMGDNRDNSQDSRFPAESGGGVGMVPAALLVGKAQRIVWSTDGSAEWLKPWTWFTAARKGRMGDGI
ncbi:signal peptidase I [Erythrobacter sp. SDW2]|uniref:signal peptidase I n=1 Tax=Erythrobacter sp. SDW2 TaxID=2907154 RepID=UPI001F411EAD|nr:signal peptidase I [Erythrobacter sp. SDW2]UIP06020.1 signal peptidase I [Erythrobacter sp. SDW2]